MPTQLKPPPRGLATPPARLEVPAPTRDLTPPLRLELPAPRCPYCHEDVRGGEPQHGCSGCRAWHHAACWSERGGRCAACNREDDALVERALELWRRLGPARGERALPVPWALLGAWVALLAVIPTTSGVILPAFQEMFREVGVRLPWVTQVALGPWSWGLAMLPFTALFLGASSGTRRGRERGGGAAMLLTVALGLFYAYALFSPLCCLVTQL